MVKTKKKIRGWSPAKMTKAIKAIRSKKMGWKKASKEFNFPKTTLMRLANAKVPLRRHSTLRWADLQF